MTIHDEAYETRLEEDPSTIQSFCGRVYETENDSQWDDVILYAPGEGGVERIGDEHLVINCEACILIKFQIDSTK